MVEPVFIVLIKLAISTAFLHSNPNGVSGGDWPQYVLNTQEFFTLDEQIVGGNILIGRGPFAQECAFWREYFPTLVTQTGM